jgi:hypothetical protein
LSKPLLISKGNFFLYNGDDCFSDTKGEELETKEALFDVKMGCFFIKEGFPGPYSFKNKIILSAFPETNFEWDDLTNLKSRYKSSKLTKIKIGINRMNKVIALFLNIKHKKISNEITATHSVLLPITITIYKFNEASIKIQNLAILDLR